jgi:type IV pilus assembly protein PilC
VPFYKYVAKNEFSETVKGKVEAPTIPQAATALRSRNLLVVRIDPLGNESFAAISKWLFGIKEDEVVNMTRQLSTMITAGLPLVQALSILEQQSKPAISKMISELKVAIEGGGTFADALAKHPTVFSRVYVQLVRAGEAGGVLDEILDRLAENLEKAKEFRAKTKGALIYPVIVVIAMVIVAFVMMIFVIPKLTEMYKDFGADLPLVTQLLIDLSTFVSNYWWVMFGAAGGGYFFFNRWGKTKKGRLMIDGWLLKIPVFGELRKKVILTEFARTLSLLLTAGISLLQALQIVTDAVGNSVYREALADTASQVEKGISLAQSIGRFEMFPPLLSQMISVGEETGKLDDVLMKLSKYFESESEHAIKNMTTALEPMIMIVLGIGVGLMVVAIIMPIYGLTSQF